LPVLLPARGEETRVRVIKERDGGIVRRVRLVGDDGEPVGPVCRFLDHLGDREFSPNKLAAYGYDLKYLFIFLDREGLDWQDFRAPHMLALLAFLRRVPSRRPAQRLGLAVVADGQDGPGRLLSPATVDRILAAVSSFYDWAILAEEYECGVSPVQMRADPALARVPERHEPYMGRASRQQPVRRVVQVKRPRGLPRPMNEPDLEALLSGLKRLQDPGDAAAHAGRRAPPGRGAVAAPSGHLLRPAPGDDPQTGTRKPAEIGNRQVRHQVVEFTQGRCRVPCPGAPGIRRGSAGRPRNVRPGRPRSGSDPHRRRESPDNRSLSSFPPDCKVAPPTPTGQRHRSLSRPAEGPGAGSSQSVILLSARASIRAAV